jgi:uncharacterized coiled-coil protein SlyX
MADWKDIGLAEGAKRIAELEAENFRLAAGACINPGTHGLVGDEHGHFECTAYKALQDEEVAHTNALARIAELEAQLAECAETFELFAKDLAEENAGLHAQRIAVAEMMRDATLSKIGGAA